jgi:hypothetical protein
LSAPDWLLECPGLVTGVPRTGYWSAPDWLLECPGLVTGVPRTGYLLALVLGAALAVDVAPVTMRWLR